MKEYFVKQQHYTVFLLEAARSRARSLSLSHFAAVPLVDAAAAAAAASVVIS